MLLCAQHGKAGLLKAGLITQSSTQQPGLSAKLEGHFPTLSVTYNADEEDVGTFVTTK
jgi:hypothetical protein